MKCVKCGAEIEEGAKFCGSCGSPVEEVKEETATNETVEPVPFSSEVSNASERQEIVQEPIPVDTEEFKKKKKKIKKNSKAAKFILIGLIAIAVLAIGFFVYFKLFDKQTYEQSINSLEKSFKNLGDKANKSGTITAKLELDVKNLMKMDFKALLEYESNNNAYKFHGKVFKNDFMDEMNFYLELDEKGVTGYIPTALFALMDQEVPDIVSDVEWIKVGIDFDKYGIKLDEILEALESESTSSETFNMKDVFPKENFKYVGRSGLSKKYTLKIDQNLLETAESDIDLLEDYSIDGFNIDFYVNSKDCLEKIQVDLKEALSKTVPDGVKINKFMFTVDFGKFNSTKVEIPASVKEKAYDITEEISNTINSAYGTSDRTAELIISAVELAYSTAYMANGGNYPTIEQVADKFSLDGATMDKSGNIDADNEDVFCITFTLGNELDVTCYGDEDYYETPDNLTLSSGI